jgi:hypothetical protein
MSPKIERKNEKISLKNERYENIYLLSIPLPMDHISVPIPSPNPSKPVPMVLGYGYRRVWVRMTSNLPTGYPCRTLGVGFGLSLYNYKTVGTLK